MEANFEALSTPCDGIVNGMDEATSALVRDTKSTWLKFIFTDDKANGNNQAVSAEEFDNLITTGLHKPFKKVLNVEADHAGAIPIGTITSLKKEGDTIVGLANIWDTEYPHESKWIKEQHANKSPLETSWEVIYQNSSIDDAGVEWLHDCTTKGVCLVKYPAYEGRTPILAVAAKWSPSYVNKLPNTAFLHINEDGRYFPYRDSNGALDMDRLNDILLEAPKSNQSQPVIEQVLARASQFLKQGDTNMEDTQKKLDDAMAEKSTLEAELAQAKSSLEDFVALQKELDELRSYKQKTEEAAAKAQLRGIRFAKFGEAGLSFSAEQFDADADKWLSLSEDQFTFTLDILKALKPTDNPIVSNASLAPLLSKVNTPSSDVETLRKFLLERKGK